MAEAEAAPEVEQAPAEEEQGPTEDTQPEDAAEQPEETAQEEQDTPQGGSFLIEKSDWKVYSIANYFYISLAIWMKLYKWMIVPSQQKPTYKQGGS